MKKLYLLIKLCYFILFLFFTSNNIIAQTSTESFETESNGSSSFTDNGVIFNIISHTATFDIQANYPGTGWSGTANDNRYIDNANSPNSNASFSIKTTSNLFKVNRFWIFASEANLNQNVTGTLTITGKLSGVTKFTQTKTNGFATSLGSTNGYTLIDLTNLNGQNYSNIIIDQLQITAGGNFAYIGLDAFTWVKDSNVVLGCLNFSSQPSNSTICAGANSSFTAAANFADNYQWQVNTGTGFTNVPNSAPYSGGTSSTLTITGATAAMNGYQYKVIASGSCGTSTSSNTATLNINSAPAITLNPINNSPICSGGNVSFSVSASNATQYQWQVDQGSGFSNISNNAPYSGANTTTLNITGATGTMNGYKYRAVAKGTCSPDATSNSATLNVNHINVTVSKIDVKCYGNSTGEATATASNGAGTYTYSWAPSGGTAATATGLAAGTYTVTVTDANNCQATESFTITQPSAPLNASPLAQTNIACFGGSTGSATVNVTGGTGAYSYSWAPSGGTSSTATGLSAGTYTVTVTDANNCTDTQSFTITQPAAALSTTAGTINNTSCNGGSNGTAQVIASGGTPGYTYSWAPYGGTNATATGIAAGTYTVTVTDANGCTATRSFTITQPNQLVASVGAQTNVSCNGGANGSATVAVTGGTPSYTYYWSPTGGTAATASGLVAGTYTVTVTDANICQTTQSFTINQPTPLISGISKTDVACNGGSTGSATVTPTGGTSAYTYLWSPYGGTGATASGLAVGNYSCLITDANGCSITKNITINQPSTLGATTSQTNATCSSGGDAAVTPFGGVGGYSYLWTPGGATTQSVSGLAAGNHSCLITDANGCSITKNFVITTNNTLVASTFQTNLLCNGVNTGSAGVIPTGAPGPYTYVWSPSGGNTDTATNLAAGNYSILITASNGCSITKNFTITQPSALIATAGAQTNVTCNGGTNGSATVNVTGGTGAYTYSWAPSGGSAATANGLAAGTYTVTVKDANLCQKTQSFTITEPPLLTASTSQTNVSCKNGSNGTATVNVTGGTGTYTYSWAPSGGINATASGLAAGNYTVTVKDANLCMITANVTIKEPDQLTAAISKTDVLCNGANNGTATVTASGGTGTYTYAWAPFGGTAATATGLSPNTYTVTVTDENGCFTTQTVQIIEPPVLSILDSHTNVSCNGGNNGSASVTVSGGTGTYTYSWAPSGGTAATATGLSAGVYTVTATDANLCSISKTITITEPDVLVTNATIIDVSCHNGNNGSASITATGGSAPYTYLWKHNGATTSSVTGLAKGTYEVILKDSNSCTLSTFIEIKQPENPVNLNTASVSEITVSGAKLSGTASSDGINTDKGECLTEVGFVYALHTNPSTADTKINTTAALGNFTTTLTGLRGNRTYYIRTYAANSNGYINYGNEVSFTTEKYTLNITASSGHTKVYGTSDPVFNYTATGFANGDTNTIITGQLSREMGENVGKYNITPGNINAGADYTIVFTGAEFEITKANQTITWDQTLEFGCDDSTVINLNATTDSGLTVSYTIANNEIGTINESTLTILNSGSTTITAVQNGDQNHNPAVAIIKPIEVSQSGLITQQWADVLLFDNKSNSFTSYQWYKNGSAVSGATRQYYSENQPLNGSYYVIAKNTNGSSIKSCPIEATGTAFSKSLKIHPNPVRPMSEFTLECDFSESQLNGSEITVFDITGKLVQTITNVKPQNQITAPSQVAIYVVVLSLSNGQKKTINLLVK